MKIRNNITILINKFWLRNITRYKQYYNLSLVFFYKFLILNLSLTITIIKLGTFFASKSQGGGVTPLPNKKHCNIVNFSLHLDINAFYIVSLTINNISKGWIFLSSLRPVEHDKTARIRVKLKYLKLKKKFLFPCICG